MRPRTLVALLGFVLLLLSSPRVRAEEVEDAPLPPGLSEMLKPWTGDLDGMKQRGILRALVVYSRTYYFVERGKEQGIAYEMLKAFEDEMNRGRSKKLPRFNVVFIPLRHDQLLPALLAGEGDVVVAGLTITTERHREVDFSIPTMKGLTEILVTGPGGKLPASLDDLSGRPVHVRRSTGYWQHLEELNQRLVKSGRPPAKLVPVPEELEDEDVLEMVNTGLLPLTVVDRFKVLLWKPVLPELVFEPQVAVSTGDAFGWAFRKDSPQLAAAVNAFIRTHGQGTTFGNVLLRRYEKASLNLKAATAPSERKKYEDTLHLFRKYGDQYGLDHLLMLAQGYQESQLNQQARSAVGAVGVMQLMPDTGKQMAVGDIGQIEPNVHAGVKYVRYLQDTYFANEPMDAFNKMLFAFAAYNAGPGRIHQLRQIAAKRGLDPNTWFRNVEYVAADKIGPETVTYVSNIFKYYVAYRLLEEEQTERRKILDQQGLTPR